MVIFKPFKALRPKDNELAKKIAALPYDVYNVKEAHDVAKDNEYCFLRIEKSEIEFDDSVKSNDQRVYAKAKENLGLFRKNGWLIQDEKPSFYIYRQIMAGRSQYSIMGCSSQEDYWAKKIKIHELTRQDKEEERIAHTEVANANAGPVFFFYPRNTEIDKIVTAVTKTQPLYDFESTDGIQHTVWQCAATYTKKIQVAFNKLPAVYVADGHHRTKSGAVFGQRKKDANPNHTGEEEYNYFMAAIFPMEDLKIFDYNRVVKDLNSFTPQEFLKKISEKFTVTPDFKERAPQKKGAFGMYLEGKWYLLTAKPGTFNEKDPIEVLDVSILQKNLLDPILGIKDPRTDKRIDFVGGIRGMNELERRVKLDCKVAFAMFPTSVSEVAKVADAGLIMPPKSTWFEPKLRSGLLVHVYE